MNSRKGEFRWRRPFSAGTKGEMGGRDPARTAKLSLKAGITAFEIAFLSNGSKISAVIGKFPSGLWPAGILAGIGGFGYSA
ncbi:MAG: hypothetical protein C6W56_06135 [Caldibacillus debilis]|nr:MAG: hypothetical protein C6W56_06135 [Caldibacillus debilis]